MVHAGNGGSVMNKKYVRLTGQEREELTGLVSRGKAAARKLTRSRVLLKADADGPGWTDKRIAEAFDVGVRMVENTRKRFVEEGLEAAVNRKKQCRPSRQKIIDGEKEARLVAMSCGEPPPGQARWTLRLLADQLVELNIVESVSHETVRQVMRKTS
jgi:transposase